MQVTTEQQNPCEIELKIEVDSGTVAQTISQVYREFAKSVNVPGFRKGKAPRQLLERYVTPESVRQRAVEIMIPSAYQQALQEDDIHPYADPDFELVQFEMDQPFIFKAIVPLPPKVELGEYKDIEAERPKVEITEEDVDAQLKYLQDGQATTHKVEDRGVQQDDILIANVTSTSEGEEKAEPRRSLVRMGSNIPGFDEQVLGMEPGQQKSFSLTYPEDHAEEELAGKKVEFDIAVESISERRVPELDDEFAKTLGEFETLADLREDIKKRLTASAEDSADTQVEQKIVDEIVSRSEVCFPNVLVEHEAEHDLENMQNELTRRGIPVEAYLQQMGKTQEQLIADIREACARKISAGLVLGEIADKESIDVTDEDTEAEIERLVAENPNATREAVEAFIESRGGRASLKNSILNRKILDYLKSVSKIK